MSIYAEMHDGTRLEFPDGTSPEVMQTVVKRQLAGQSHPTATPEQTKPKTWRDDIESTLQGWKDKALAMNHSIAQGMVDTGAGALKGASQIGSTILAPLDMMGLTGTTNTQRRNDVTSGLSNMGADTNSIPYKIGDVGAQIAGTAGVGGALAKGLTFAPKLASAVRSGGFSLDAPAGMNMADQATNAATRLAGGAIQGGAMAGMVDPNDIGTGAAIGAAIPVAGKLSYEAGKLLTNYAINPLFKPTEAALTKLVEDAGGVQKAQEAINKAIQSGKTLSGESYTLGQAGKNWGLAATERARAQVKPENYQPIYEAQRNARVNAMQGIGQDETTLNNAIENRDSAANSLYGKAFSSDAMRQDTVNAEVLKAARNRTGGLGIGVNKAIDVETPNFISDGMQSLLERPSFQSAVKQAKSLAKDKGIDIGDPTKSLEGLHLIKLSLDDMLNPQAASAMGRNASASIMDIRDKLAKELSDISPLYGNARSTYTEMSKPINQMKVGQNLTEKITGKAMEHGADAKQQAEQFFRALKNAPSIVKTETGIKQPLSKVFDKNQMQTIGQVAKELSKDVDLQTLGRGTNSDTVQKGARSNLLADIGNLINSSKLGRSAFNVASLGAKERMGNRLDAMLQNPELANSELKKMNSKQLLQLKNDNIGGLLSKPTVQAGLLSVSH